MPDSLRFMLQLYPPDCFQIQAEADLGFQARLGRPIYNFTTALKQIHILRIWELVRTARLLYYSSQYLSSNKHWILPPNFQYFPLSHLSQEGLKLMMQHEDYVLASLPF